VEIMKYKGDGSYTGEEEGGPRLQGKKSRGGRRHTGEACAASRETVRAGETWHEGRGGVLLSTSWRQIRQICDGSEGPERPGPPGRPGASNDPLAEDLPKRTPP